MLLFYINLSEIVTSLPWSISVPNSEKELRTTYLVPYVRTNIVTLGKLEWAVTV